MNLEYKIDSLSIQDYLEGELHSKIKHEYIDGQVYAMAGASTNHNRIVANMLSALHTQLTKTPCEPFASDMKVQVADDFYYPDVLVVCDHHSNDYGVTDTPIIIVEVLSKATRKIDQTLKRQAYQSLESLQEYIVIEQDFVDVDISRRKNHWQSEHYFMGDELYLESIDLQVSVEAIYERVENGDVINYLTQQANEKTNLEDAASSRDEA
ncbi:Uma2 family endonuclease [Methylotuvimicrobium sp. KM2]|uniref:Uma2 family endonuclease n=1 Tax=Methylotuvimicrobium sp. KM2 TaxID=3133976 RepID=UPI003100F10A